MVAKQSVTADRCPSALCYRHRNRAFDAIHEDERTPKGPNATTQTRRGLKRPPAVSQFVTSGCPRAFRAIKDAHDCGGRSGDGIPEIASGTAHYLPSDPEFGLDGCVHILSGKTGAQLKDIEERKFPQISFRRR